MKTTTTLLLVLLGVALQNCQKQGADVSPAPDYKTAIDAKYKVLGWVLKPDNGGDPLPTIGKKGWVQYYGNHDRAIYYYPVNGTYMGGAFGMLNYEMLKYDKIGQDTFAYVASDPKEIQAKMGATPVTVHYNDIIKMADKASGIVITNLSGGTFIVYGAIYQKYLSLKTWDGPLGYPVTDELDTNKKGARYNYFSSKGACIVWSGTGGAQAYWGRIDEVYKYGGNSSGWLGFPTSSCDPAKADKDQTINFEGGRILMHYDSGTPANGSCGTYQLLNGTQVDQTGTIPKPVPGTIFGIPCV